MTGTWFPRVGDRIEYSEEGLRVLNPRAGQRRGVVAGKGHAPHCVRVRWDGRKTVDSYSIDFLRATDDAPLTAPKRPPVHDRILAMVSESIPVVQIAQEVGRTTQAVYSALRKAGISIERKSRYSSGRLSFWNESRCGKLAFLWNSGLTCTEIAAGLRCSRNAVIGKAHRMKLTPRHSPIKRAA